MNEELETAKEELQSINEELTTVNDELQNRNHEMTQVNSDLVNLLTTVDIPILILDAERRIRRFTPKARRILNVLPADVGRPLDDIKHEHRRGGSRPADHRGHRDDGDEGVRGPGSGGTLVPAPDSPLQDDGEPDRRRHPLAPRHRRAEAPRQERGGREPNAERANHTKDEFLATLSHELRTPLSSMLMHAQLLRRGAMDEAKMRQAAEAIETGVRMQVQLIDDLLDVSRIVTGKLNMDLQPVDLARVVTAAIDALSVAVERKSLKVTLDLASGEPQIYGDERRLQQIVSNLLINAIKFTPKHGTVMVSLAIAHGAAVFRVADTGIGIDPAFLPDVFNRFTQENSSSSRAYGGLGLGLAIVRHLVELHHGKVAAESPGTGMGATFSVTLPLMQALRGVPSRPKSTEERPPVDVSALKDLRILVVDDDRATREAVADMLEQAGASVRLAPSSAEAMKALDDFRPELLVCDIAMPGEDGYAFLRRLRAFGDARSRDIPALAFTALARDEDREHALAAGYQMHIAKPVDLDHFTEVVLALAATRPARSRTS